MNKIILTIIGAIILILVIATISLTTFFKTPNLFNSTNFTSPLYTYQYSNIIYPNPNLTPGQIQTNDMNVICYHYYDQLLISVPQDIVDQVYKEYNITSYGPGEYEIDHWIPLALGGSNELSNLWPQPINFPGYREKDYVQLYLHDEICNHNMSLIDARNIITGDWLKNRMIKYIYSYYNIKGGKKR